MKISIVTPSYNQAQYLPATLASLLNQDYPDAEFIIRDGGSTDGSVDVLRQQTDPRLSWWSRRDRGQADAINQGLAESTGDIVAYLNSDDVYYPGTLAAVGEYFRDHPECQILYGDAHHLHADGTVMEEYYTAPFHYQRFLSVCYLCQPTVFWRRSVMERYGVFDETLHFAMDYDYWLRVGAHETFHYLKGRFLAGSRLHGDTKTLSRRVDVHREILRVVRRHTDDPRPIEQWLCHLAHYEALGSATEVAPHPSFQQRHQQRFASALFRNAAHEGIDLSPTLLEAVEPIVGNPARG